MRISSLLALLSLAAASCGGDSSGPSSPSQDGSIHIAVPEVRLAATPEPGSTPAASEPVRFIAVGDTGTGASGQMDVADAIAMKCAVSGCDFGVLLGDNFYEDGVASATDPQFDSKFQAPYGDLGFPFYVVLGNHDYGSGGYGNEFERGAYQIEYAKTHPNFILPSAHYDFEAGAAAFLVTDTNLAMWDFEGSTAKQTAYFQNVLSTTDRPWKIAFTHHPVISNGKHGNVGEYDGADEGTRQSGAKLAPLFEDALCGQADVYLSGHDHNLQVLPGTQACPGTFVVSGAGAKVTSLQGSNPALFQKAALGFAYVVITDESVTVEVVDVNADTLFSTELKK